MIDVTSQNVKDILKYKDKMLENIYTKMQYVRRDMAEVEKISLAIAALPGKAMDDMPGAGSFNGKDLADTVSSYHKQSYNRSKYLMAAFQTLVEKEDTINRVWAAFYALDEPYFSMLKKLYVDLELYATVEAESGYSHGTFEKRRQRAMDTILMLYRSNYTTEQLVNMQFRKFQIYEEEEKDEQVKDGEFHQLSLLELVKGGKQE